MSYLLLAIMGTAGAALCGASFRLLSVWWFRIDFMLVIVLFSSTSMQTGPVSAVFVFLLGTVSDNLAGLPLGTHSIVYILVWSLSANLRNIVAIDNPLARFVLVATAGIFSQLIVLFLMNVGTPDFHGDSLLVATIFATALITALASLAIWPAADRIWKSFGGGR